MNKNLNYKNYFWWNKIYWYNYLKNKIIGIILAQKLITTESTDQAEIQKTYCYKYFLLGFFFSIAYSHVCTIYIAPIVFEREVKMKLSL